MDTSHKILVALAALAIPVAGATAHGMLNRAQPLCFSSGGVTYQMSATSQADFRVRVDNNAPYPDLRIRLATTPDNADFILADDTTASGDQNCTGPGALKMVQLAPEAAHPDIVIALAEDLDRADVSIYVRSSRFSSEHAAALQAAMWMTDQTQRVAER